MTSAETDGEHGRPGASPPGAAFLPSMAIEGRLSASRRPWPRSRRMSLGERRAARWAKSALYVGRRVEQADDAGERAVVRTGYRRRARAAQPKASALVRTPRQRRSHWRRRRRQAEREREDVGERVSLAVLAAGVRGEGFKCLLVLLRGGAGSGKMSSLDVYGARGLAGEQGETYFVVPIVVPVPVWLCLLLPLAPP